jgi:hypothetical protein
MFLTAMGICQAWVLQPDKEVYNINSDTMSAARKIKINPEDIGSQWLSIIGGKWNEVECSSPTCDLLHQVKCVVFRFDLDDEIHKTVESMGSVPIAGVYVLFSRSSESGPDHWNVKSVVVGRDPKDIFVATTETDHTWDGLFETDSTPVETVVTMVFGIIALLAGKKVEIVDLPSIDREPRTKKGKRRRRRRNKREKKIVLYKNLTLVSDPPPATLVETKVLPPPSSRSDNGGDGPGWHQRPHWRDEHTAIRWVKDPAGRPVLGFGASSRMTPLYAVRVPVRRHKRGQGEHRDVTTITTITTQEIPS